MYLYENPGVYKSCLLQTEVHTVTVAVKGIGRESENDVNPYDETEAHTELRKISIGNLFRTKFRNKNCFISEKYHQHGLQIFTKMIT